jgi:hypothetical protein
LNHIPALTKALGIPEPEILSIMEREYAIKVSGRLALNGHGDGSSLNHGEPGAASLAANPLPALIVASPDYEFMNQLYNAYRQADTKTRQTFASVCESILNLSRKQA